MWPFSGSSSRKGAARDVVSGEELFRALEAGISPRKIVYSGVGKTRNEIDFAIEAGILMFDLESVQELHAINARARELKMTARISFPHQSRY